MSYRRYPIEFQTTSELERHLASPYLDPSDREKIEREVAERQRASGRGQETEDQLPLFEK